MSLNPLVSVIVPCFDAASYISPAIESILGQTFKDFEVIVVDDGSADRTKEVLSKYNGKIKYIYQENRGAAVARNRGIFGSKGKYLAFCDADDIWEKDKLYQQVLLFDKNPDLGLCAGNGIFINQDGTEINKLVSENRRRDKNKNRIQWLDMEDFILNMQIYPSTLMVRKAAIEKTGLLFDQNLFPSENVLMELKIMQFYKAIFLNKILIKRRFLINSASHNKGKVNRYAQIKIFKAALQEYPTHRKVILKRLIHSKYSVARRELRDGNFKAAKAQLIECTKLNKLLGRNYFKNNNSFVIKLRKILIPYILLSISCLPNRIARIFTRFILKESDNSFDIW